MWISIVIYLSQKQFNPWRSTNWSPCNNEYIRDELPPSCNCFSNFFWSLNLKNNKAFHFYFHEIWGIFRIPFRQNPHVLTENPKVTWATNINGCNFAFLGNWEYIKTYVVVCRLNIFLLRNQYLTFNHQIRFKWR